MAILHVERLGGLAGIGGTGARIRSQGQLDISTLSTADQTAVESLFQSAGKAKPKAVADGFRYRISRTTSAGTKTVEVAESEVPAIVTKCVKDEFV